MRTAKKTFKAKSRTKPKAKAPKALTKTQPRADAKATAKARKVAPRSKAKAAPKAKVKPVAKSKAKAVSKAKAAPKAKTAPKSKSKLASKSVGRQRAAKAAPKTEARSTPTPAQKPPRRDATGHLDPKYARDLRALSRENHDDRNDRAFFQTPRSGDDLAEELGEEAVETMTSGEDQSEQLTGEEVEEERGGPFIKTRGEDEFAGGTDRSNPSDATREPFPRT